MSESFELNTPEIAKVQSLSSPSKYKTSGELTREINRQFNQVKANMEVVGDIQFNNFASKVSPTLDDTGKVINREHEHRNLTAADLAIADAIAKVADMKREVAEVSTNFPEDYHRETNPTLRNFNLDVTLTYVHAKQKQDGEYVMDNKDLVTLTVKRGNSPIEVSIPAPLLANQHEWFMKAAQGEIARDTREHHKAMVAERLATPEMQEKIAARDGLTRDEVIEKITALNDELLKPNHHIDVEKAMQVLDGEKVAKIMSNASEKIKNKLEPLLNTQADDFMKAQIEQLQRLSARREIAAPVRQSHQQEEMLFSPREIPVRENEHGVVKNTLTRAEKDAQKPLALQRIGKPESHVNRLEEQAKTSKSSGLTL
jgi:hypothetical protein